MKGQRSTGQWTGKGFYIVLLLCVAVIGVTGFTLLRPGGGVSPATTTPWTFPTPADDGRAEPSPELPAVRTSPPPRSGDDGRPAPNQPATIVTPQPSPPPAVAPSPAHTPAPAANEPAQEVAGVSFFVRPVDAALPAMFVDDALTYNPTLGVWRFHGGIDIYADLGSPVMAVADGVVESVDIDMLLGNLIVIRHAGGLTSTYANLDENRVVSIGDNVSAGDVIGAIGNSAPGKALQASHLHFEMRRDGAVVNPLTYLPG